MLLGALAVLAVPGAFALARFTRVSLFQATYAFPAPILLGLLAVVQARRAREALERTLGRVGGERGAAWGRGLGLLGFCLGTTAGLALGFYWLLIVFAR